MTQEKPRRARGGQPKDPAERKSSSVTFRIREQLKQEIEASARYYGRTVSEEIGFRLERSFIEGGSIKNLAATLKWCLSELGSTDQQIEEIIDSLAFGSPAAASAEPEMLSRIMERVGPGPRADAPSVKIIEPPTLPPNDLEDVIYRAMRRALHDDREASSPK